MAKVRHRRRGVRRSKTVSKAVKKYVKRTISVNEEHKYIDLAVSSVPVSTTMLFGLINGITQGTTGTNRVGAVIKMLKMQIRYQWQIPSGGDFTNLCRLMIILDKQANGAIPAAADILVNPTDPLSFINEDNTKRFKFLHDKLIDVSLNGPAARRVDQTIRLNKKAYYTSTGNLISNIKSNSLYVCYMTDSGIIVHPNIIIEIRLWYTDA